MGHIEVVIEPYAELLLVRCFVADANVVVRRRFPSSDKNVRQWIPIQQCEGCRVDSVGGYRVVEKSVAQEAIRIVLCGARVVDRCTEDSLPLKAGWHSAGSDRAGLQARSLIIDKEEGLVLLNRAAEDKPILVSPKPRFRASRREKVTGVQRFVPEKLEQRAVKIIRTRL